MSTHVGPQFRIYSFKFYGTAVVSQVQFDVSGDVTSIHHSKNLGIIVGLWKDGRPYLQIRTPTTETGSRDVEEIDIAERKLTQHTEYGLAPAAFCYTVLQFPLY